MKRGLGARLISAALLLAALPVLDSDDAALAAPTSQAQSPLPPQPPPGFYHSRGSGHLPADTTKSAHATS